MLYPPVMCPDCEGTPVRQCVTCFNNGIVCPLCSMDIISVVGTDDFFCYTPGCGWVGSDAA